MDARDKRGLKTALVAVALLGGAMLACKAGKIDQCNKLIQGINAAQEPFTKVGSAMSDPAAMATVMADIEKNAGELEKVEISDEKLIELRSRYANNMRAAAKAMSAVADDLKTIKDNPMEAVKLQGHMKEKQDELQKVQTENTTVSTEITTYCAS